MATGFGPAAELNGSGALISRFVYAGRPNVPEYMIQAGVTYRLIHDQVGSVRLVVNASTGAIAQRLDYDAYGRVLSNTAPDVQPFGFAGGLYDPQTGLVRFGERDYGANVGRWTKRDPILMLSGRTQLFGYASSDPTNRIDSSGLVGWNLSSMLTAATISGIVGGVVNGLSNYLRDDLSVRDGFVTGFVGGFAAGLAAPLGGAVVGGVGAGIAEYLEQRLRGNVCLPRVVLAGGGGAFGGAVGALIARTVTQEALYATVASIGIGDFLGVDATGELIDFTQPVYETFTRSTLPFTCRMLP